MDISQFKERFSSEEDCLGYLFDVLWPNGWRCHTCQFDQYWFQNVRRTFQCKQCLDRRSITTDTLFSRSKSPLSEWFLMIFLICKSQGQITIAELMQELGAKDKKRVIRMRKEINALLEKGDSIYQLAPLATDN